VGVKACGWVNALKARWDGGRHYCYQRDGRPCGDPGRVGMAHTSGSGERLRGGPEMFSIFQMIYPKPIQITNFKNRKHCLPSL
jgi:hypothetical protein